MIYRSITAIKEKTCRYVVLDLHYIFYNRKLRMSLVSGKYIYYIEYS